MMDWTLIAQQLLGWEAGNSLFKIHKIVQNDNMLTLKCRRSHKVKCAH